MGYDIIYDKQFVKVGNEFIPFLYSGSSNCYSIEVDRRGRTYEKRERSWNAYKYLSNYKVYATAEELIANAEKEINNMIERYTGTDRGMDSSSGQHTKEEILKSYGYFTGLAISGKGTRGTSARSYLSLIKSGIKNAKTIEELKEHNVYVEIYTYCYEEEEFIKKHGRKPLPRERIESTLHFYEVLKRRAEYNKNDIEDYLILTGSEYSFKRLRHKEKRILNDYKIVIANGFYKISVNPGFGYLVKYTKRGLKHTYYESSGLSFLTEKEAETYLNRLRKMGRYMSEKMKVIKIQELHKFKVSAANYSKYIKNGLNLKIAV